MSRARATVWLMGVLLLAPAGRAADVVESPARVPVAVEVVSQTPDAVRFQLTNQGPHPVRDIEVLVSHAFLWSNERAPGAPSPSRAHTYALPIELAPGETTEVSYLVTPPLPARGDGRFAVDVDVVRWKEVLPPRAAL